MTAIYWLGGPLVSSSVNVRQCCCPNVGSLSTPTTLQHTGRYIPGQKKINRVPMPPRGPGIFFP